MTVSTAAGLVLTGIGPRGLFSFFLDKQKEATISQSVAKTFPHSKLKMWKKF
jgi:hypothetical protein